MIVSLKRNVWIVLAVIMVLMMVPTTAYGATEQYREVSSKLYSHVGEQWPFAIKGVKNKKKVKWTSSNPSVVKVNSKGVAVPVRVGKATITGTYRKKKTKFRITVLKDDEYMRGWLKYSANLLKNDNDHIYNLALKGKDKKDNDFDKVLKAVLYIKQGTEYGATGSAKECLLKRKGTCVSANLLLVELLKKMGYQAKLRFAAKDDMRRYPGVVFAKEHHNVKVKVKGKWYYVDATPQPVGWTYFSGEKKPICMLFQSARLSVAYDRIPGHVKVGKL